jgi:hypothetical protein
VGVQAGVQTGYTCSMTAESLPDGVVSRDTITTECADIQSLVEPVLGLISDRAYALGGPPNGRDRVDSGVSGRLDQPAGATGNAIPPGPPLYNIERTFALARPGECRARA